MSHIRDTLPQSQGSKDCLCPVDLQGAFLMEQLPRERQCQFILKPSRLAAGHQLNGAFLCFSEGFQINSVKNKLTF